MRHAVQAEDPVLETVTRGFGLEHNYQTFPLVLVLRL